MIHRMDPPADPGAQPMPERIEPMLSSVGALPREDSGWAFEIKWDGVRAVAYSEPGRLRILGRSGDEITARYPELARLNRALHAHSAVLDGEIVALDADGRPSFDALQRRMHVGSDSAARRLARDAPVTYVIFDLLWLDGHSLLERPYSERRAALRELSLEGEQWRAPEHIVGHGAEVLAASRERGLEGVVAKRLDSQYEPGRRSGAWLKLKNVTRQEFVIGGWQPGAGRRGGGIGSLLLGVQEESGALRYVGRVGSGLDERELAHLARELATLERPDSPFDPARPPPPRGAVFCEPRLVAEVEFRAWTRGGMLRAPSFVGLREDKPASEVVREAAPAHSRARRSVERMAVGERELDISNRPKVLYPAAGTTKGEVIDYYASVAPVLLPHLRDRPLTVKRYPNGVAEKAFFQKQSPVHRPTGWRRWRCRASAARRSSTRSRRMRRDSCGSRTSPRSSCTCHSHERRSSAAQRRSSSTSTPGRRRASSTAPGRPCGCREPLSGWVRRAS